MEKPLTLNDLAPLHDIRLWGFKELWTLEEAAYIVAGIDPNDVKTSVNSNWESAPPKFAHSYQIKFYNAILGAITTSIEVGTLTPFSLWVDTNGWGDGIAKVPNNQAVSAFEIITTRTTIQPKAFGIWLRNKGIKTLREELVQAALITTETTPAQNNLLELNPFEPVYDTPEFDAACEVIKEFWNEYDGRGKPPKEIEIQEFIKETLTRLTGDEPSKAAIQRIDTLTRPPQFKNQKPKKT